VLHVLIPKALQDKDHCGGPLSLKGGEMQAMLLFARSQLIKFGGVDTFGAPFLGAIHSLCLFYDALGKENVMPSLEDMSIIREQYDRHLRCCYASGIRLAPKHHLTCHMVNRTAMAFQASEGWKWRQPFICPSSAVGVVTCSRALR
jgi:hypothetical protein